MHSAHLSKAFRLMLIHWQHLVVERKIKRWHLTPFFLNVLVGLSIILLRCLCRPFLFQDAIVGAFGNDSREGLPLGTTVGP